MEENRAFELQPRLSCDLLYAEPLKTEDFAGLFAVGCDPLIWEQHPNPDRYKEEVFRTYFEGAMESGGAFLIRDIQTGEVMGSSRYYEFEPELSKVKIGYTFLARKYWGGKFNGVLKRMMLEHAFRFVDNIEFHVGARNLRSQLAMGKIGGRKVGEKEVSYHGEGHNLNFIYIIEKERFLKE